MLSKNQKIKKNFESFENGKIMRCRCAVRNDLLRPRPISLQNLRTFSQEYCESTKSEKKVEKTGAFCQLFELFFVSVRVCAHNSRLTGMAGKRRLVCNNF